MTTGQKVAAVTGLTALLLLITLVVIAATKGIKAAATPGAAAATPGAYVGNYNTTGSVVTNVANINPGTSNGGTTTDTTVGGVNASSSTDNNTGSNPNTILPLGASNDTSLDFTAPANSSATILGQGIN